MLITQFRKFTPINMLWLGVLAILLCIPAIYRLPPTLDVGFFDPDISEFVFSFKTGAMKTSWSVILALIVTLLQALYLNQISNQNKFFGRSSFLVALLYVLLASVIIPFLVLSPVLLSNFILIWMLQKLLTFYHNESVLTATFDLGILVAVGSLIYFPFIGFSLAIWVGLALFRTFNWREWFAPLLGAGAVYFLLWVIYFWHGQSTAFLTFWSPQINTSIEKMALDKNDLFVLAPVGVILLLFLITIPKTFFKKIAHVRKSFQLLLFILMIAVATYFLNKSQPLIHFLLCVPTVAIYMGYYFHYVGKKWVFESLFAVLLLVIVALLTL